MPSGMSAFLVEVAHLPRNAVASRKKRTTTPRRHPLVPLVRPRRQAVVVVLQRISFLSGAVVACHFLATAGHQQEWGECERNGVQTAIEAANGFAGCI
jgi:hypothetical protein